MEPRVVDAEDGIRLGQLLKLSGLAESGGHARALLAEGEVTVNGEAEDRRGRRLLRGDVVVVALPTGEETVRVG
ncbi:RNA-binding protein S4 [Actinotalea ferrariae CF5-4]|uniref:RNA-binding protein S4 n=1 Tax=Actinotalea ferrariae CF5-4 TaxID=948458 RepID=A0A021VUC9_9CELL|nr:RNA-binding S4 domain-containing protein [Actinotalea ferrariae]EYR64794.1 RNA-binding protein S4 [Actinotalea ferrariae CF5-4]